MEDATQAHNGRRQSRPSNSTGEDEDGEAGPSGRAAQDPQERRKQFLTTSNLKRVFRHLDLGEDGYLDVEELYEAQKQLGGKLSKEEVRDIMWEVDDDMTGKLDWQQFKTAYERSQADELRSKDDERCGFEPKRFYSIVEFLLMDRDCSGEISLDEAMTTLFERYGADDLATVTRGFFKAAGIGDDDTEPPAGTTVTFMGYYAKVGCAKPRVKTKTDLRRTWSYSERERQGRPPPPELHRSSSSGLLPSLVEAEKMAKEAAGRSPRKLPPWPPLGSGRRSPPKSRGSSRGMQRPFTSPSAPSPADLLASPLTASRGAQEAGHKYFSPTHFKRGMTGVNVLASVSGGRPSSTGLAPLRPLTPTAGLAASSLEYVGKSSQMATAVKQKASNVLHMAMDQASGDVAAATRPEIA